MGLNKNQIKQMVIAERLMDEGLLPFVYARGPSGFMERLPVSEEVMEEFGLVSGQKINSMIHDAILAAQVKLVEKTNRAIGERLDEITEALEDALLDDNFDFRKLMNDE